MTVTEKVAYLKGLAEGLDIAKEETKEARLINAIIDALEDLALSVEDLEENALDLAEEIDVLSADLADVEGLVYEDDEDAADEDEEELCDCCYSVECPSCGDEIVVDEGVLLEGSIACPNCGETLEFEFDEDDESDSNED